MVILLCEYIDKRIICKYKVHIFIVIKSNNYNFKLLSGGKIKHYNQGLVTSMKLKSQKLFCVIIYIINLTVKLINAKET